MSTLAPALRDDFPNLALREAAVRVGVKKRDARRRLQALDHLIDGRKAAFVRTHDVPAAYRAFARQVGLDPDVDADPFGDLVRVRLGSYGSLPSDGPIPDACSIALLETGVPVWGIDGSLVVTALRLEVAPDLTIVVGDGERIVAPVFGPPGEDLKPTKDTTLARLFALVVPGVAVATVDEALWCAERALAP